MLGRTKKFKMPKISTVIGRDTQIRGDVVFCGGLHVDGTVRGSLTAHQDEYSTLVVSEFGVIEGDVRVANVVLNGTVVGDVFASGRVELAAMAKVNGTVYYRLLEMTMGAEINGQLIHTEEQEPARLAYDREGEKGALEAMLDTDLKPERSVRG